MLHYYFSAPGLSNRLRRACCLLLIGYGMVSTMQAQELACAYTIQGTVRDHHTAEALIGSTIYVKEIGKGAVADVRGQYLIEGICAGTYTLICRFEGYAADTVMMEVVRNIRKNFGLEESATELQSVTVKGEKEIRPLLTLNVGTIRGIDLETRRGLSLGESLKGLTGVYSLQTGPTISKPVIHGLYNNRVLILNNSVRQEGQQWGNEHAPEIDPFIARSLSVVKGAASIRYGSDAIGGVVLVEPPPMPTQKGMSGEMNLVGASNGRLGVASARLEGTFDRKLQGLSWRLQGTLRRAGNANAANYFLENTGIMENSYAVTVAYNKPRFGAEIYFSHFNSKLGIFTGSYAESTTDIQQAIERSEPITPSYFSYDIGRPYQQVNHNLIKIRAFLNLKNKGKLEAIIARQQNDRSEFGYVPLNGRENPELLLELTSHTVDVTWTHAPLKSFSGSIGLNGITQGNIRKYQFLIPNYRNYGGGIFAIERWSKNAFALEGGLRYDYRWLRAYYLDGTTANRVEPTYIFNNITATLGALYDFSDRLSIQANIGTAWRPPAANELFSDGVHQSAASYERGNLNLTLEKSFNTSVALHYHAANVHLEVEGYQNLINNFIYLKPDLTFVKTIRGSFPSYTYTPADVSFRGMDASFSYYFTSQLSLTTKASLVWAYNHSINDYLIFTPPNRFDNFIQYEWKRIKGLGDVYVRLTNLSVAQQQRVPANSDYAPPPAGYVLFGTDVGFTAIIRSQPVMFSLSVTNLFNVSYRDYLNRFRYFADDLGSNVVFRIKVPFDFTPASRN